MTPSIDEPADDDGKGEREDADREPIRKRMRSPRSGRLRRLRAVRRCVLVAPCGLGGHVVEFDPGHRPSSYLGVSMIAAASAAASATVASPGSGSASTARSGISSSVAYLAGGERLEPEMVLVAVDQRLQPARLGEHAPFGLEEGDRLALLGDVALEPGDPRGGLLGLVLQVVGDDRAADHRQRPAPH